MIAPAFTRACARLARRPIRLAFFGLVATLAAAGLSLWLAPAGGTAQEKKPEPTPGSTTVDPLTELKVVERVRSSTTRGLDYLRDKQRPDGSWHNNHAVNALALLAFMGRGHTPGRGPYKDVFEKGKKYLLSNSASPTTGYRSMGTMYEHGLATLAMAEMYGMDPDPDLEKKLREAVDLIIKVQSPGGGWNYSPTPGDGDLSVSVMQIVALRAANNAEIPVPPETIQKAIKYVQNHSAPAPGGGYGYNGPGPGTPQTTAAGILSLQLLGAYNDPTVLRALDALAAMKPPDGFAWERPVGNYFYYFHYYAIQANYQAGGKYWDQWHPSIRETLLTHQNKDGSWDVPPGTAEGENVVGPNKVYWTAMACVVLDIYMHFLPAYQR
jgi:hypothetical protein